LKLVSVDEFTESCTAVVPTELNPRQHFIKLPSLFQWFV